MKERLSGISNNLRITKSYWQAGQPLRQLIGVLSDPSCDWVPTQQRFRATSSVAGFHPRKQKDSRQLPGKRNVRHLKGSRPAIYSTITNRIRRLRTTCMQTTSGTCRRVVRQLVIYQLCSARAFTSNELGNLWQFPLHNRVSGSWQWLTSVKSAQAATKWP